MKRDNPNIEKSIFNSIHTVALDTFPGYKTKGEVHSFLEHSDQCAGERGGNTAKAEFSPCFA